MPTTQKPSSTHPPSQPSPSNRSSQQRKPQTLGERLRQLPLSTWIIGITGVIVIAFIILLLVANSHPASNTSAGIAGPTCGVTTPLGTLTKNTPLSVGTTAPNFTGLPTPDCTTYSLSQFAGKSVVVLELFATWCPHCQNETQVLNQLQASNAGKGVQILSVTASPNGHLYEQGDTSPLTMADLRWFTTTFSLKYPALYDPSMQVANSYGLDSGYPTYYVINKAGVITSVGSGEMGNTQIQSEIDAALQG